VVALGDISEDDRKTKCKNTPVFSRQPSAHLTLSVFLGCTNKLYIQEEISLDEFKKLCTGEMITSSGMKQTKLGGVLHSFNDKPSHGYPGYKKWHKEGVEHRDNGPVVIATGDDQHSLTWKTNGFMQREAGPCYIFIHSERIEFRYAQGVSFHNLFGPAMVCIYKGHECALEVHESYYINGTLCKTREEFLVARLANGYTPEGEAASKAVFDADAVTEKAKGVITRREDAMDAFAEEFKEWGLQA